jgi:hypothetical protein
MAQAVQKINTVPNEAIGIGAYAPISGLSITILNGSGWIRLTGLCTFQNAAGATRDIHTMLFVDGSQIPDSYRRTTAADTFMINVKNTTLFKPGAGQHTYDLRALTSAGSVLVFATQGMLQLDEPGY